MHSTIVLKTFFREFNIYDRHVRVFDQVSGAHRYKFVKRPVLGEKNTDEELFGIHYHSARDSSKDKQDNTQPPVEGMYSGMRREHTYTWSRALKGCCDM